MKFCKCGCGQITKIILKTSLKQNRKKGEYNNFIKGHYARLMSKEQREKKRLLFKNNNPMHNLSLEKKQEWRKKLSISMQGRIPYNKGKKRPEITGEKHPRWKGKGISDGYVILTLSNGHKIKEHHLVIEKKLHRHLKPNEIVHHIDKNRSNNNEDNLLVMDRIEHARQHALGII